MTLAFVPPPSADEPLRLCANSAAVLSRLERTLEVLLAPIDAERWAGWREEAHASLRDLVGGTAASALSPPGADADRRRVSGVTSAGPSRVAPGDEAMIVRGEIADGGWGGAARRPSGSMMLGEACSDDEAANALLRAVQPALRAALAAWHEFGARQAELASLLDAAAGGMVLLDVRGRVLHENVAYRALADAETAADAARLREAVRVLACGAGARRPVATYAAPPTALRTACYAYDLCATLSYALLGAEPSVCVAVRRRDPAPLTERELRDRYGLTPRECEVARLVGEGLTNREIAERLGVSSFTVRNHCERLFAKLGVPCRSRVGAVLRAETA